MSAENSAESSSESVTPRKKPITYKKIETEIEGEPQVMHFLELDLTEPGLTVFPVLSGDCIFGFEHLSVMNDRYHAQASVNGGFNYAYGQPAGLVIQNGKLLTGSMGYGRILMIQNRKAWFQDTPTRIWLEYKGTQLPVDRVNPYPADEGILVFTPEFGPTNRIEEKHIACVVRNNRVVSVKEEAREAGIPKDGFLVVDLRTEDSPLLQLSDEQEIDMRWEENADQGYQCSGSLVENGQNVSQDYDPWGGNMRIRTPRTAVGIKDENTLVFLVIDGRQPRYSKGVTGKQLADVLIAVGVTEAALLDGGASSEMIVDDEIVNSPSTGKERLLASAFIIRADGDGETALKP